MLTNSTKLNDPAKMSFWYSWPEWQECLQCLKSEKVSDKLTGLDIISMWRTRAKLPVAVEMTASVMEAMLQDTHYVSEAPVLPDHCLQLMYSMAIVRVVNTVVDTVQKKEFAMSVSDLAKTVNLPGWIVDLRHSATHKDLPSLSILRMASTAALKYFFDEFWAPQQYLLEENEAEENNTRINKALQTLHSTVGSLAQHNVRAPIKKVAQQIHEAIRNLRNEGDNESHYLAFIWHFVIPKFVEEGFNVQLYGFVLEQLCAGSQTLGLRLAARLIKAAANDCVEVKSTEVWANMRKITDAEDLQELAHQPSWWARHAATPTQEDALGWLRVLGSHNQFQKVLHNLAPSVALVCLNAVGDLQAAAEVAMPLATALASLGIESVQFRMLSLLIPSVEKCEGVPWDLAAAEAAASAQEVEARPKTVFTPVGTCWNQDTFQVESCMPLNRKRSVDEAGAVSEGAAPRVEEQAHKKARVESDVSDCESPSTDPELASVSESLPAIAWDDIVPFCGLAW